MTLIYRDRGTSGTQLDVLSGTIVVSLAPQGDDVDGHARPWSWQMSKGPPGFSVHDRSDTKAEAQAAIENVWQGWLAAAGLRQKEATAALAVPVIHSR